MQSAPPTSSGNRLQATNDVDAGFPLPGESADGEAWTRAFTLEPSQAAALTLQAPQWQAAGVVSGSPTLWREAAPTKAESGESKSQMDFVQRLDRLTKQLDSLTGVSGSTMQGTAELFLFVAIGLLLLLAIDTLLRFAVHMVSSVGKRRIRGLQTGGGGNSRWLKWRSRLFK